MATNPYRIVIIENKSTPTTSFKLKKMESDTEAKIAAVNSIIELNWSSSFLFIRCLPYNCLFGIMFSFAEQL